MSGQLEAAEETANRLVSYAKQHSNSDPSQYASALEVKGKVAILQKKLDVAVDVMNQAIEIQSSPDGEPLELAELQGHVGAIYLSQRRLAEAEPLLLNASQVFRRLAGSSDERAVEMTVRLAEVYLLTERPAEAEKLLKRVHATRIFQSGRDSAEARHVRDLRVTALRAMEKNAEADELLREPRPFVVPAAAP